MGGGLGLIEEQKYLNPFRPVVPVSARLKFVAFVFGPLILVIASRFNVSVKDGLLGEAMLYFMLGALSNILLSRETENWRRQEQHKWTEKIEAGGLIGWLLSLPMIYFVLLFFFLIAALFDAQWVEAGWFLGGLLMYSALMYLYKSWVSKSHA